MTSNLRNLNLTYKRLLELNLHLSKKKRIKVSYKLYLNALEQYVLKFDWEGKF